MSVNYERLLFINEKQSIRFSSRIGIGLYKPNTDHVLATVPFELLFWPGKQRLHPEFGLGYTPFFGKQTYQIDNVVYQINFDYFLLFRIGIKYRFKNSRLILKLGITPLIYRDFNDNRKTKISLWGGLSSGIRW